MNTSDVLNLAADLIEERGWRTGAGWITPDYPVGAPICLEGGLMAALGMRFEIDGPDYQSLVTCPAYRAVSNYLALDAYVVDEEGETVEGQPLYDWNDSYRRTVAEVVEVLRATAVIEAARENAESPAEVTA